MPVNSDIHNELTMSARDLISFLEKFPDETPVIIYIDPYNAPIQRLHYGEGKVWIKNAH